MPAERHSSVKKFRFSHMRRRGGGRLEDEIVLSGVAV